MAECLYCTGNHSMATKIDRGSRIEANVVPGGIPYLDVKVVNRDDGSLKMHAGFSIRYCPMCGRRLWNG